MFGFVSAGHHKTANLEQRASCMSWEPSVRTRHLTVIIFLVLLAAGALLCFNVARLLNAHTAATHEKVGLLAEPISYASQQALFTRPLEKPEYAIGLDETVRKMIRASTEDQQKGFAYCALVAMDGAVIAQSD